jgi:hypothetical protein
MIITDTNSVDHNHHSTGATMGWKVKRFGDQTDVWFLFPEVAFESHDRFVCVKLLNSIRRKDGYAHAS